MKLPIRVSALVLGTILVANPAAAAPTKDQCLDANGKAQSLRTANKLVEAREQLLVCLDPACPGILRDDCGTRLEALNAAQPSIVFEAKGHDGRDLTAVVVKMDGKKIADKVGGDAMRLNPGSHEFTFETPGEKAVSKTIVLREGEVGRHETIAFGDAASSGAPAASPTLSIVAGEGDAIRVDSEAVGVSRWSGPLAAGHHQIDITHEGKKPYSSSLELTTNRSLSVTLENDKSGVPLWIWIAGGAVVASGMAVGGYFLFKGDDTKTAARPVIGGLDSGTLTLRFGR